MKHKKLFFNEEVSDKKIEVVRACVCVCDGCTAHFQVTDP